MISNVFKPNDIRTEKSHRRNIKILNLVLNALHNKG